MWKYMTQFYTFVNSIGYYIEYAILSSISVILGIKKMLQNFVI